MSELLDLFSKASNWSDLADLSRELSVRDDPADVPALQAALNDPLEARRYGAVYVLGFNRRDKRVVSTLIRVPQNQQETPRVRAQAAECLGYQGKRKAINALIQSSTDESAEVRFWCVFAMGQYPWRRRGRKLPLTVVRALEARLGDNESPDDMANWWAVGLEALAMLAGRGRRHPANRMFRETVLRVLKDPLNHRDQWQWADGYWDTSDLRSEPGIRALYASALQLIRDAGFEPERFGRERQILQQTPDS
jgi:hypothetical protein